MSDNKVSLECLYHNIDNPKIHFNDSKKNFIVPRGQPNKYKKLKLFGVDTRSMTIDYIFLNNESFDFRVDKALGMKKYLVESLTALDYHNERMDVLDARSTNRT